MSETHDQTEKMPYSRPELSEWGSVADLTATGQTHPGDDNKSGSILHSQGK